MKDDKKVEFSGDTMRSDVMRRISKVNSAILQNGKGIVDVRAGVHVQFFGGKLETKTEITFCRNF